MRQRSPGFSLLEVMLTIFVLGLVLTMGVRRGFQQKPLEHFPHLLTEVASLATFAHIQALSVGRSVALVFAKSQGGGFSAQVQMLEAAEKSATEKSATEKSADGEPADDLGSDYFVKTDFVTSPDRKSVV